MTLTPKQQKLIEEYLIDLNATQAAIRAGYSPKTAKTTAHQTLHKPKVATELAKHIAQRSKRTGITQDRVLNELAKIAFTDINNIINLNTKQLKQNIPAEDTATIERLRIKPDGEIDIQLTNKIKALELLTKHLGATTDTIKIIYQGENDLKN